MCLGAPGVMPRPADSSEDDAVHLSVMTKFMTNIDTKAVTNASQPFSESPSTDPGARICHRAWAPLETSYSSSATGDLHTLVC